MGSLTQSQLIPETLKYHFNNRHSLISMTTEKNGNPKAASQPRRNTKRIQICGVCMSLLVCFNLTITKAARCLSRQPLQLGPLTSAPPSPPSTSWRAPSLLPGTQHLPVCSAEIGTSPWCALRVSPLGSMFEAHLFLFLSQDTCLMDTGLCLRSRLLKYSREKTNTFINHFINYTHHLALFLTSSTALHWALPGASKWERCELWKES